MAARDRASTDNGLLSSYSSGGSKSKKVMSIWNIGHLSMGIEQNTNFVEIISICSGCGVWTRRLVNATLENTHVITRRDRTCDPTH